MKRNLFVALLLFVVAVPLLSASTNGDQSMKYLQGTVVSVEKETVRSPEVWYFSGTDAPLQSEHYAYNVSVRVGCITYHGRYETVLDYLPTAISQGKAIQVRLTKRMMHFDVAGDPEFTLRGKERCPMADNSAEQL